MPPSLPDLSPADLDACKELLRRGSKSFFAASRLLPRDVREDATALYAFCRVADDAIDEATDPQAALIGLQQRLDAIYAARGLTDPVDRALASVIMRHKLPRPILDSLLDGFAWDTEGRTYETLSDVIAYAVRVAATVGVLMTLLMGERRPATLARACDLGIAMQLTNIARDVGEDARLGRLYLPRAWMRAEGLDPDAWLAKPVFDERLGRVVRRILETAGELYERSRGGIGELPSDCRAAIHAARLVYSEIGEGVQTNGYDSVTTRAVITRNRKFALIARALTADYWPARNAGEPCLPETRVLIEAVQSHGSAPTRRSTFAPWPLVALRNFRLRTIGVVQLFERIERRRMASDSRRRPGLAADI